MTIEGSTAKVQWVPSSGYEMTVARLLERCGLELNGPAALDPQVTDNRFFQRVIRDGSLGLGESYMEGWWEVRSLDGFLTRLLEHQIETVHVPWIARFERLRGRLLNLQNKVRCRKVVEEHYDLDNFLYERMLDSHMQYTCAYYSKASNLEEAQDHKLDQICRKLQLGPGQRLLDLGCGFGGLARFAAERYGCEVTGYNISREQLKWARNHCADLPVTFMETDYRNAVGQFDKVVSVGLCEHVGYKNHRALMEVAHRCLKPGGLFLLHCIGGNHSTTATDPWLEKYIFPGSVMPSPRQISTAAEGLFVMEDWHNFGVDYDRTCMAWFENFDRNWPEIRREKFDERFYRLWKYYLLLCAASFRARKNQNWEVVFSKGGASGGYTAYRG